MCDDMPFDMVRVRCAKRINPTTKLWLAQGECKWHGMRRSGWEPGREFVKPCPKCGGKVVSDMPALRHREPAPSQTRPARTDIHGHSNAW